RKESGQQITHPVPACAQLQDDHDHGDDGDDHDHGPGMQMTFYTGVQVTILFEFWHVMSSRDYFFSIVILSLLCMSREWLSGFRAARAELGHSLRKAANDGCEDGLGTGEALAVSHCDLPWYFAYPLSPIDSSLYGVSLGVAYLLMLVAMTYNVGIFLTVCIACAVGHYLFSVRRVLLPSAKSTLSSMSGVTIADCCA
ncbi:MAG: hypothetical protein MHM6MM_009372, partial [Cercozoa sp. M6MM]